MPEKAQPVVSNDIINTIKKKQILEEIVSVNPTIPMALLELIWDSVREMDDRKLKQLRKGNLKIKNPIKRPVFEDGQILTGCCEIKENDLPEFKPMLVEEPAENKVERLSIVDEAEDETCGSASTATS